jgi:hypothetical protein
MPELPTPDPKLRITDVVDKHCTAMMEELNELHEHFLIPDEEILAALRGGGYGHEADMFAEWILDEDPPRHPEGEGPDPEGPGGYVTDPPSDSYIELERQLNEQRKAASITYEWTERERQMFSCKATVNRSQFQTWLRANVDDIVTPEDVDAETLVEFLEADYSAVSNERRMPADHSETDCYDLKVVDQ